MTLINLVLLVHSYNGKPGFGTKILSPSFKSTPIANSIAPDAPDATMISFDVNFDVGVSTYFATASLAISYPYFFQKNKKNKKK